MKKALVILLALGLLLNLAGCTKEQTEPAETTAPAAEAATEEVVEAPAEAVEEELAWPTTTIQWVLAGTAGSGPDTFYRALIPYLEESLGATIVPQNVLWNAAVEQMLEAEADGHTISNMPTPNAYKRHLDPNNNDDPSWADCAIVCSTYVTWECICLRTDDERFTDVNTLDEFVAWCQANPDEQLLVGVKSAQSTDDLTLYLLQGETGLSNDQLVHVTSTNASERNTSFLNKGVDLMIGASAEVASCVNDGSAKVIAVFNDERLEMYPDAPTAQECGIDVMMGTYNFIVMDPETDPAIVEKLAAAVQDIYENPEAVALFESMGYELYFNDSAEFTAYLQAEEEALGQVKSMWGW